MLVFRIAYQHWRGWQGLPRTDVLGSQPSLRDWSCWEGKPSTACWAILNRPFGTRPDTTWMRVTTEFDRGGLQFERELSKCGSSLRCLLPQAPVFPAASRA